MARRKKGKLLYGVGKAHPIKNASSFDRKMRKTWGGMLERCYCPKFRAKNVTYSEVVVCDEWLDFTAFAAWYRDNYVDGWFLDKDLTVREAKTYSPDTCCFVPRWLNNLLIGSAASRGKYPQGVTSCGDRFKARFSCDGVSKYLGLYDTVGLASQAYREAKASYILSKLTRVDVPEQVKQTLRTVALELLGG